MPKLNLNKGRYSVTIPIILVRDALHWHKGDNLTVSLEGKKIIVEKGERYDQN